MTHSHSVNQYLRLCQVGTRACEPGSTGNESAPRDPRGWASSSSYIAASAGLFCARDASILETAATAAATIASHSRSGNGWERTRSVASASGDAPEFVGIWPVRPVSGYALPSDVPGKVSPFGEAVTEFPKRQLRRLAQSAIVLPDDLSAGEGLPGPSNGSSDEPPIGGSSHGRDHCMCVIVVGSS